MSTDYVLDSSAWIEYLSGSEKGKKVKNIVEKFTIFSSIMVIVELADKFARENKSFDETLRFIQSKTSIIPINVTIACSVGRLKKQYRGPQNSFGVADAIHLATANEEHAILVTSDPDFKMVSGVLVL